jgi:hypothetical protein
MDEETMAPIACGNAEGIFLQLYCIFKENLKNNEFEDGIPPGFQ